MNITLRNETEQLLPSEVTTGIAILLTIITVVGFFENSAVIFVFFNYRRLRTPCNLYITGLAVCDFLHCTIGLPLVTASAYAGQWMFDQKGCIYYGFVTTFLGITQITILTFIAFERYKCLQKDYILKHESFIKPYVKILVACYSHGFIWATFPLVGWSSFKTDTTRLSCCINWSSQAALDISYLICLTFFGYIIPVVSISSSYYAICLAIRRRARRAMLPNNISATDAIFNFEKSVTITVFIMIAFFLVSWTPYAIVSIVVALGKPNVLNTYGATLPGIFAKCSTIWNPIIYVILNGKFRRCLYLTLSRISCRE